MPTQAGRPRDAAARSAPPRRHPSRGTRGRVARFVDGSFFVLGTLAAVWLAWLLATEGVSWGWWLVLLAVLFWALLAYLVLPRLHRILTRIYVPDYFIGRARTSDGLLGDPINLAVLGSQAQLESAMAKAGWTRADPITTRTTLRIITSTVMRRSYDEAPVSPLLLFGRQQDLAYQQEVAGNPAKRHHVRFWKCPPAWRLPGGGRADWLGAGTFDRAVGFSLFTLQVTHKIAPETDVERDHVVRSLTTAEDTARVDVIRDFSTGYHSRNGGGDSIVTDGDLPVVDLGAAPEAEEFAGRRDVIEAGADRRPLAIVLGCALLALRAVAGIVSIAAIAIHWATFAQSLTVDIAGMDQASLDQAVHIVALVVIGFMAIVVLVQSGLIILIYRGSNWARIVSMTLSAIATIAAAVDYFNGGRQVVLYANLLGLPLDILVLLALSSLQASAWTRRIRYLRLRRRRTQ